MAQFAYQARDQKGVMHSGSIVAPSVSEAGKMLRAEGKYVIKLAEASESELESKESSNAPVVPGGRKVKRDDVIYFAHQMAIMLETGVPIGEALDAALNQATNPAFHIVLEQVSDDVQSGVSFSAALAKHQKVFPNLMISLLRASEASGTMGQMLDRVSHYLSKERATAKKIRSALMYPMFMLTMALGVTAFLLVYVLPKFEAIYSSKGEALPTPTRILLAISSGATHYWYLWVGLIVGTISVLYYMRKVPTGRRWIDHAKLNMPVVGTMFHQLYITRAMQAMGTMTSAGVPVLDMITITKNVTNNVYYQDLWERVDECLQQGAQLSVPLEESPIIPASISRMIASGEKAGRLGKVMERIAEFSEAEFDESIKRTTQFIEPAIVSFMGIVIGGVAISLLLPVFSIGKVMAN